MKNVKNIIFTPTEINIRAGGPAGYVANLEQALLEKTSKEIAIVSRTAKIRKSEKKLKLLCSILTFFIFNKKIKTKAKNKLKTLILGGYFEDGQLPSAFKKELDKYEFTSITCHSSVAIKPLRKYLNDRKLKANLILMSHCPESIGSEIYDRMKENGADEETAQAEKHRWEKIELNAFDLADTIMFPSEEAMEPYYQTIDNFDKVIENKNMVFIATGCKPLQTDLSNEEILNKYNIPNDDKINFCFIGRHTSVKGYDLLMEAAQKALEKSDNIRFIIGGKESPSIKPLNNENWLELGFVNPAEVLKVADVFILPNRRTYFDLVLLEVLSTNTPVFATNTGGNKSVYTQTNKAIEMYDTTEQLVEKILEVTSKTDKSKNLDVKNAYETNYSLKAFAERYINLVNDKL